MIIGLRFLAFFIDVCLCFFSYPLVFQSTSWIVEYSGPFSLLVLPLWFTAFAVWPFAYFGIPTGIWGRTPGRFLCRLKVVNHFGEPPGLWRGLGRETLKLLALASVIGALFCIIQLIHQGTTWYDYLCTTFVEYKPPVRLTQTQRNFRKQYKPPR